MNVVAYTERRGGDPLAAPPTELNPVGEFQMINVGDFRMIIDRASFESCFEQIPRGFPSVGASLTLFLTDGALLGLCSAWAVSSFLPVPRLGLVNPEGYIAFSLFPHLSDIPPVVCGKPQGRPRRPAGVLPCPAHAPVPATATMPAYSKQRYFSAPSNRRNRYPRRSYQILRIGRAAAQRANRNRRVELMGLVIGRQNRRNCQEWGRRS